MSIYNKLASKSILQAGEVALIGAGPGDAELLTIKALRLIEQAEVVIYDRLVSSEIMHLFSDSCRKIYVGKALHKDCISQDKINDTIVEWAHKGKKVVRLKGGDSFIFGRGSEEVNYLLAHNIASHVVPGITAASGATTYAGIPLTHRNVAHSCSFITGHFSHDGKLDLPWQNYADKTQTLVFYMGVKTVATISEQLINHGRESSTPVAIIHKGTQIQQKVWRTTLANLPSLVAENNIKPPSLLVIGDVVNVLNEHQQLQDNTQQAFFAPDDALLPTIVNTRATG
ncbi:uroporphyrinogen-III C-methyltransferase [Thalassomonas sp. M1454]|uniref:uroporphyrinogen-III C-methyltransferase n=1 Tax=Thalassomonas sp. M1454 TaxID=2594477 RepID=UPI00117D98AE|nr:uroporphyrinogen-III C-methyltransferase [Thalassomonas sp. M1454]TRX57351.1 uroporphyrinogen-III C-methyltransferase [Thalassomonas sp. M1454]